MTPLIFDLIILAAILLSVALGYLRGFLNEVFTIFGWIAAIIATIYFTPVLRVYGRELIKQQWLADLATSSAIFLVTLGVCSAVSYFATRSVHATKLGIVDRILGFAFGILRAVVLLGMVYQLFTSFYSEEHRPDFVTGARTLPFLEASASWVSVVLPIDMAVDKAEKSETLKDAKENAEDAIDDLKKKDKPKDEKDPINAKKILNKFHLPELHDDKADPAHPDKDDITSEKKHD